MPPSFLLNPALGPVDSLNGRFWTPNGSATVDTGAKGKQFTLTANGSYYTHTGYRELTTNIGTLAIWFTSVGAANTNGHVYLSASSPASVFFQITSSGGSYVQGAANTGGSALSGWYSSKNRSLVFVSGGTAATCKLYVDGVDSGHTYTATPTAWGSGLKNLRLGGYPTGVLWDNNASESVVCLAPNAWNAKQAKEFHDNPNIVFAKQIRRIWTPEAAAPGGFQTAWARNRSYVIGAGAR